MILEYSVLGMEFFQAHFNFIDLINHFLLQLNFILQDLLYHLLSSLHQATLLYLIHFPDHFLSHSAIFIKILEFNFLQYLHSQLINLR